MSATLASLQTPPSLPPTPPPQVLSLGKNYSTYAPKLYSAGPAIAPRRRIGAPKAVTLNFYAYARAHGALPFPSPPPPANHRLLKIFDITLKSNSPLQTLSCQTSFHQPPPSPPYKTFSSAPAPLPFPIFPRDAPWIVQKTLSFSSTPPLPRSTAMTHAL